jgi:molybdopterin molybdotransferase
MTTYDSALNQLLAAATPLEVETVSLDLAEGRVLAQSIIADRDQPSAPTAAMDGYAVDDADWAGGQARLRLAATVFAGQAVAMALSPGVCVRVLTGAPTPAGTNRVVVSESCTTEGTDVILCASPSAKRHIRPKGADFRHGDVLVQRGRKLDAGALVAAAAADVGDVRVHRRPVVRIIAVGDELVPPGEARNRPNRVPETVSHGVAALCRAWGAVIAERSLVPDDLDLLRPLAAQSLAAADVVVVIGGAGGSERDYSRAMFGNTGLTDIFRRPAIRPGRPVWAGRAGRCIAIGLPGNPTAALVTARLFLAPALAGLAGRPPLAAVEWEPHRLQTPPPSCDIRETFLLAERRLGDVFALQNQDSSGHLSLGAANAIARLSPAPTGEKWSNQVPVLRLWD